MNDDDIDLADTCKANANRLNADDLLGREMLIKIVRVTRGSSNLEGNGFSIHYEGGEGKPFEPCKTMGRLIKAIWGTKGKDYVGREMVLFNDPDVTYGKLKVGGVRISHASHLPDNKPFTAVLQATSASKKPYTVLPLSDWKGRATAPEPVADPAAAARKYADDLLSKARAAKNTGEIAAIMESAKPALDKMKANHSDLHKRTEADLQAIYNAAMPAASKG